MATQRMLRDWTDSEAVNSLSVHAERLFTRLIMKVDDYGCFTANLKLIKASLFPLLTDKIREADLSCWLEELQKAGLVLFYESTGKRFFQIINFNQRLRTKKSKYPLPGDAILPKEDTQGYVYLIGVDYSEPIKIGFSLNPWARVKEISVGSHIDYTVLLTFKAGKSTESVLHRMLKSYKVRNEWFNIPSEVIQILEEYAKGGENNGLDVLELLRSNWLELRSGLEDEVEEEEEVEKEGEGEGVGNASTHSQKELISFQNFNAWIKQNAPRVARMKKPFTIDQYLKIIKNLKKDIIEELLVAMENRADLHKKYQSAYLTLNKWSKMNFNQSKTKTEDEEPTVTDSRILEKLKAQQAN